MVAPHDVRRVDFGYFIRPAEETDTGRARVEPVLGYLVRLANGFLLFDTGMAGHPDVDAHYRPTRRPLSEALSAVGVSTDQVRWVINCHLHFDHCGGNPEFAGRPIFTQRTELAMARTTEDYTMPWLVDFAGVTYEEIDGETEVLPDVLAFGTSGHTHGHQSLAVRCTDGTIVLAGQAHDTATEFGADTLAARARREGARGPLPSYYPWLDRLLELDPRRVFFAHDQSVWEPG